MRENRSLWRQLLPVFLVHAALTGLMVAIFYLVGHGELRVVWGALLGLVASAGNFIAMTLVLLWAAKQPDPARAKVRVQLFYILRMVLLVVVLVVALKTPWFQPISTLLPLVLFRIAIMISELFQKKGDTARWN